MESREGRRDQIASEKAEAGHQATMWNGGWDWDMKDKTTRLRNEYYVVVSLTSTKRIS